MDDLREHGPEADLSRIYAGPLAAQNLIDLLGLREASVYDMQRWSRAFIAGYANLYDDPAVWLRCDEAQNEIDGLLAELIPHLRNNPDGSMIAAWAASDLPSEKIAANVKLSVSGGMNEPEHVLTGAVWALSRHPDQRARVLADPGLWPAVFDETVRWLSPIGMYPRQTTTTVTLEGIDLPTAAPIGVVIGAANRDTTVFPEANSFDISRPKQPHLGFGSGVHLCAGHWVARISLGEIALPLLFRTFPGLRTEPERPAEWHGWVFRGITKMPVTLEENSFA
jgi:cytochrome P450